MNTLLKGVIRNGRVEVNEPIDLPEGTEVVVTPGAEPDDGLTPPAEIARVLAAMHRLKPLDVPEGVATELDAWERKLNQHGIDNTDTGIEDEFR